jgi:hypothetical protein
MKKLLLIPLIMASFAFASTSKTPDSQEPTAKTELKLIDEVLSDYRSGNYTSFLKRMDATYREENKKWKYNSALEERKKLSTYVQDYGKEKTDVFKTKMHALVEAQDRELADICINYPDETFSREVRDLVFFTPSPKEQASLDYLHGLSYKFKGDGITPLENKLINIDTEFWLKELSLGVAKAQNKIDQATYQKQHIVLQIEKLKQMKDACSADEYGDTKTQELVTTACNLMPKVHAASVTRKHLIALGLGKIQPKNQAEKEMQAIVAKHIEKEQALIKEYFPNDNSIVD